MIPMASVAVSIFHQPSDGNAITVSSPQPSPPVEEREKTLPLPDSMAMAPLGVSSPPLERLHGYISKTA